MFSINRIFSALGAAALLATIVVADPPARVARINYLQGPVSLQRGDLGAWDQAVINYPMVANDSLWTDDQARAELHIGSTALRLADQTSISFLNLNDQVVQIRLAKGVVELHLNRLDPEESYEIDTPCASASLSQTGDYRLEVDEAGDATIITRRRCGRHKGLSIGTGSACATVIDIGRSMNQRQAAEGSQRLSTLCDPSAICNAFVGEDNFHKPFNRASRQTGKIAHRNLHS